MNTNALAFMRLGVDYQVGMHFEPFGHGTSETLISVYPLFKSIRKQSFGITSGLNIGKSKSLKCATNFRLYNQFGRLAKVYSGYKLVSRKMKNA